MKLTIIRNMFTVTITTALGVGMASTARAAEKECSNTTLTGTFAFTNTGLFTAAKTSNPERGLHNLLERDRMFTDRLRKEVGDLGLHAIQVTMPSDRLTRCECQSPY